MEIQARPVGGMDLRRAAVRGGQSGQIQNMFEFFQLIRCGMRKELTWGYQFCFGRRWSLSEETGAVGGVTWGKEGRNSQEQELWVC